MNLTSGKILCAIDFSGFSEDVVLAGQQWAERFDARLLIFHSVCAPRDRCQEVFDAREGRGERARMHWAREKIEGLMEKSLVPWEPVILTGDPVENLLAAARREKADMVLAASRGMSGLKRLILGTVVERFARFSEIPVLVLRESGRAKGEAPENPFIPRRIAVCCILDSRSRSLAECGTALAAGWQAELILIHSLESPFEVADADSDLCSYEESEKKMQDRVRETLMDLVPPVQSHAVAARPEVLLGVPGEQAIQFINAAAVDLVIVGSGRRGPVESFMVGSTTKYLLRHAPCSVLSVDLG